MELERSSQLRFARPLEAVGDWSYSIYLSHTIVVSIVGRAVVHFMPHWHFAMLVIDVFALPTVVLVGYLSYTWIERPTTKFLYKRSGKVAAVLA